jgi:3-phosphoshikimate 1-carboxyvinyltransferase
VLRNVKNLQYKESNRIKAIEENVTRLGGKAIYENGTLTLLPSDSLHGGIINSFNDHRIAMSFAIAGTRIEGVTIDNPECVSKSYPDFWNDFTEWKGKNDG